LSNLKTNKLFHIFNSIKTDLNIYAIMLLCILQFAIESVTQIDTLHALLLPPSLLSLFDTYQYWQLFTPVFVHFTFTHLLSNLFLFWYFGKSINQYNRYTFLLLFLVAAVISNMAEFLIVDEKFGGISGVNFALFGFIFIYHRLKPNGALFINSEFSIAVLVFLLLTATDWIGDYSFISHLAGLLVGLVFGFAAARKDVETDTQSLH